MARLFKWDEDLYLKLLLYGLPGSTKTRTSYTAEWDERTAPALVWECGGNPESFRSEKIRPKVVHVDELKEFNAVYEWLSSGQPKTTSFVEKYGLTPPYKTVIFDGITEVQRYSMDVVTGNIKHEPGSIQAGMDRQKFGQVLAQMTMWAKLFLGLPMHVIITAQEREQKDEQLGSITYSPLVWGQSSTEICGYALAVGRLMHRARLSSGALPGSDKLAIAEDPTAGKSTAVAFFQPSGKYVAKDQYGVLGPFMTDPSIPKMLDLIYGPIAKK
jgi:hypothetical protein